MKVNGIPFDESHGCTVAAFTAWHTSYLKIHTRLEQLYSCLFPTFGNNAHEANITTKNPMHTGCSTQVPLA